MSLPDGGGFVIRDVGEVEPVRCSCGWVRRALTGEHNDLVSVHVVDIEADSKVHFHRKVTETYYVLEGTGQIELDEQAYDIHPGTIVHIRPGTRHRAIGKLKVLNIVIPPFDPDDVYECACA